MRFKAEIQNIRTFTKFVASLASLGQYAWVKLSSDDIRFTVIPEQGTQVWAVLSIDSVFSSYNISSIASNIINLEVPLQPLQRALRTGFNASTASIRLTKRDKVPILCLTITTFSGNSTSNVSGFPQSGVVGSTAPSSTFIDDVPENGPDRETVITQDIPIRVLSLDRVEGIHEPRTRDPDVNILLPSLNQLRIISDRFTKLAQADRSAHASISGLTASGPKLVLSANMHGCLRLGIQNDSMSISTTWTGLLNPQLNPAQVEGGEESIRNHPTERMKRLGDKEGKSEEGWARVRIDGRDWMRVMSVGRLGAEKVIACFCDDHALILYVFMDSGTTSDNNVLTYYVTSYSA